MCVDHLFLGLAIFMASGNVDRLMQRFGIVQSASVNVFSIIHAAGSMRMMLGGRAGMKAAAAGAGGGAAMASTGSSGRRGGRH
jgi:hypothetical protein